MYKAKAPTARLSAKLHRRVCLVLTEDAVLAEELLARKKLASEGKADRIALVSLGDEIGLAKPPATDHAGFRAWLKEQGLKPADLDPAFGDDWDKVRYSPTPEAAKASPALYYHSQRYAYRFGIRQLKERTKRSFSFFVMSRAVGWPFIASLTALAITNARRSPVSVLLTSAGRRASSIVIE